MLANLRVATAPTLTREGWLLQHTTSFPRSSNPVNENHDSYTSVQRILKPVNSIKSLYERLGPHIDCPWRLKVRPDMQVEPLFASSNIALFYVPQVVRIVHLSPHNM